VIGNAGRGWPLPLEAEALGLTAAREVVGQIELAALSGWGLGQAVHHLEVEMHFARAGAGAGVDLARAIVAPQEAPKRPRVRVTTHRIGGRAVESHVQTKLEVRRAISTLAATDA